MRILHISEAFGGGLRTAITNYIAATPEFEHAVYARARPGWETVGLSEDTPCELYGGGLLGFYVGARRAVEDGSYDIVHLHSSFAGVLRAILPRSTRIVYSPHCFAMEGGHGRFARRAFWAIERYLARRPQLLIGVSPREVELGRQLRPSILAKEVPNAASPHIASYADHDDIVERPTVAMVGRITAQKDPAFFAEVAATCQGNFDFLWIGAGDEGREHLERSKVRISGWVTPEKARQLLSSAALYVHSAAWEGGPLATLEAAEAGCPVMSRTIPSMESLGYYVVGTSAQEVATAVDRFATDPEFANGVRMNTKHILEKYTFERMATALRDAYTVGYERLADRPR